ncbi:unnamed protein product [Paramecium primaurelia]|uniref:Uncharacterized protein n=1 Tax=Paramecium primaurelia TaxID=5886 RepID=A0A8S1LBI8_PARPR|nr:unnamed protein product [Paramecium primaurelia]
MMSLFQKLLIIYYRQLDKSIHQIFIVIIENWKIKSSAVNKNQNYEK